MKTIKFFYTNESRDYWKKQKDSLHEELRKLAVRINVAISASKAPYVATFELTEEEFTDTQTNGYPFENPSKGYYVLYAPPKDT